MSVPAVAGFIFSCNNSSNLIEKSNRENVMVSRAEP
jgi:hypothetical protein